MYSTVYTYTVDQPLNVEAALSVAVRGVRGVIRHHLSDIFFANLIFQCLLLLAAAVLFFLSIVPWIQESAHSTLLENEISKLRNSLQTRTGDGVGLLNSDVKISKSSMHPQDKSIPIVLQTMLKESPFLQSVLYLCGNVWNSYKTIIVAPIQNVLLYQPPVGIVTGLVAWQWIQTQFFPNEQKVFLFGTFGSSLLNLFIPNSKHQRPKSFDIDTNDRQYNFMGGVQSRILAERAAQDATAGMQKLIEASACAPRAGRLQCVQHSVETVIHYYHEHPPQKERRDTEATNGKQTVLLSVLELRALDCMLRYLRDKELLQSATVLQRSKQSMEARLTMASTTRPWDVLQWRSSLSSLTQLRTSYQDTLLKLQNVYDQLGQVQQLLLDQPAHIDGAGDFDNDARLAEQFLHWNNRAKVLLHKVLIKRWSEDDSTTSDQIMERNLRVFQDQIWDTHHWSVALKLVTDQRNHLRRHGSRLLSEWNTLLTQQLFHGWYGNIALAAFQIGLAKVIHHFLAPHWPQIAQFATSVGASTWGILEFRFYQPLKVIVLDLMNRQRPRMLDPTQLQNEQESLYIMLQDLGITVDNKSKALAAASRLYEEQLKNGAVKNMIFGKMVRLLLIQVQQLKTDLLQAFQSIDELVDANRLNVSLLAIIPAVLLVRWSSRLLYALMYRIRARDVTGLRAAHLELTNLLRQLEQILILAKEELTPSELGQYVYYEHTYLLYLDYYQPPFPLQQIDSIYQAVQDLLPQGEQLNRDQRLNLLKIIHQKHADLLKSV